MTKQHDVASEDRELDDEQLADDEKRAEAASRRVSQILDNPRTRISRNPNLDELSDPKTASNRLIGGRAARVAPTADALRHLHARALWEALHELEPPSPMPVGRQIDGAIALREAALDWLSYVGTTCGVDDVIETVWGDAVSRVPLMEAAFGLAQVAELEIRRLGEERNERLVGRTNIAAAKKRTHGARGPLTGRARCSSMLQRLGELTDAGWSLPQIAALVIESADGWHVPPCPTYVADLLDKADRVRVGAIEILAARLREATRPSGGARRTERRRDMRRTKRSR